MRMALRRIWRKPGPAIAIFLFAAIIAAIICELQAINERALENYEEVYQSVPVRVTVNDLTGTKDTELRMLSWVYYALTSSYELGDYIKDVSVRMSRLANAAYLNDEPVNNCRLIGLSDLEADKDLFQAGDGAIRWFGDYDESVLASNEQVCIVPEDLLEEDSGFMNFIFRETYLRDSEKGEDVYECKLRIVGTYSIPAKCIYCPFSVVRAVYRGLNSERFWTMDSIHGTLVDNYRLEEFREKAAKWFVAPTPTGVQVPWDYAWYTYYPYALVIDDSQLMEATQTLNNSLKMNQLCSLAVFLISVVAGFLLGFLTIRSRKREITLMRALGTGNGAVWLSFMAEQMLCVAAGTILGGAVFLWRPALRLLAFLGIFFLGLTLALVIFLHSNLLATGKEE